MWLFYLWLLAQLIRKSETVLEKCPEKCFCNEGLVNCRKQSFHTIPKHIPTNVRILDLRYNYLTKISREDFKDMKKLEVLLLSWNRISTLDENTLNETMNLKKLVLTKNRLKSVLKLSTHQLSKLHYVDLSSNNIVNIMEQLLWNIPNLRILNLANNAIQTLPKHIFDYSKMLQTLILFGNPLNCDCRWLPLINFIRKRCDISPICRYPSDLHQQQFTLLNDNQLRCHKVKVMNNNNEAKCEVEDVRVTFIYKGEIVDNETKEINVKSNGIKLSSSKFHLDSLQCALNHNFTLQRVRLRRQLLDYPFAPQFTLKPKDRSYREGSNARLDCEVIGKPRPTISWYFGGKKLKRSRKYEMNFEQTNLNISPFLERDVGKYTCVAENAYGRIEASATIHLISSSPPLITVRPENQVVPPGVNVTFRCQAEAEPRPFITWFLDGSEIPLLKGHFHVSDDETELTISRVTKRDEGVYSCMAGNTVGSMMAEARLSIDRDRIHESPINDHFIQDIFEEAMQNVDSAIEQTREKLSKITSPRELMRWFQFSFPQAIEINRAREIYEESIRLIQKHVEKGLILPLNDLPTNVSFESVLPKSHVDMLMQLAGCSGAQARDPCDDKCFHSRYRSYDGQCNNEVHTMWGASEMRFRRLLPPIYENGFNTPVGWNPNKLYFGFHKPNARLISRKLFRTDYIKPHGSFSAMLMQWGQFIDHDMDFTATAISRRAFATGAICNRTCENLNPCFNIALTKDDPRMIIDNPRYPCIEFERSSAVCGSGETSLIYRQVTYREQMNTVTSYIDGSTIYGSTEEDAYELRDFNPDKGLLRYDIVSSANKPYMPFERDSSMDCRRNWTLDHPVRCFLAGDFRANEQLGLMSMHTIFMREHNRVASELGRLNPGLDGETIFQETRKIVGAELQHITFHDWLPKVLGQDQFNKLIGSYRGYQPMLDASVSNAFATAAFRFGHTLINPILYRFDENFAPIWQGHILLRDAFFVPEELLTTGSVDPYLRGLFAAQMKKPTSEEMLNDELTEKLFNQAHEVALDLAAINIQRGRDHALPGYVEYRKWCNLSPVENWDDLRSVMPSAIINKLQDLYGHPGNIDLFAGGIAEERHQGALVGPTFSCIIAEQFRRIRDGDRFWYEKKGVFSEAQKREIMKTSLARIICDNADNINRIQDDVFLFIGRNPQLYNNCANIPKIDLRQWQSCCYHSCPVAYNRYRRVQRRRRRDYWTIN